MTTCLSLCSSLSTRFLACLLMGLGGGAIGRASAPGALPPVPAQLASVPEPGGAPKSKNRLAKDAKKARQARNRAAAGARGPAAEGPARPVTLRGYRIQPGCSLKGANLTGADLAGYDFKGVSLVGARVFGARTFGARNLDLKGAEIHPFFAHRPKEKVGQMRYLLLPSRSDQDRSAPGSLVCSSEGNLFWLESGGGMESMNPTGSRARLEPLSRVLFALKMAPNDILWGFGDERCFNLRVNQEALKRQFPAQLVECPLRERPDEIVVDSGGTLWLSQRSALVQIHHFHPEAPTMGEVKLGVLDKTRNPVREAVMGNRAGDTIFHAYPDRDLIIVRRNGEAPVEIPVGGRPQCPAAGPGNSAWFLLPGLDALIAFPDPGSHCVHQLPPRPGLPSRGLARLALGPDGNLWFTQKGAGRIGRMTPEGKLAEFQLPPGHHPVEIVRGHDGRMLFTLEGKRLIGSIRAVAEPEGKEPSAASAAEAAASWVETIPARKPEKQKEWTSAQRHARMDAWYQEAERRAKERKSYEQPEAKPAKDWFWAQSRISAVLAAEGPAAAGSAPEPRETQQRPEPDGEPPAPGRPLDVLAEVGATLPPTALEHILERHGMGGMPHKSQFAKEYSTPEGILALIARHLPGAWAGTEDYTCDEMGRTVTYCRQEGVGWYNFHGALIPTSQFAVVTEHVHTEQGLQHAVVTAYPDLEGA